jgi:two-component system LytT family response regulator
MTKNRIRVLLVDDEEPARERLRGLLASFDDVEVVGEAQDGGQALEKIQEISPDLLFLDVQMPGAGGLEVAASLPSPGPGVIFCTAFDQYTVDAFELLAVDYLLKPVNQDRLEQAMERVREVKARGLPLAPEHARRAAATFPLRFLARKGNAFHIVPREEVLYFVSDGDGTRLQANDSVLWMQPVLGDLESSLDPVHYFRISRSTIVNLNAVEEVVPLSGNHGEIRLRGGARLEVSRRRFKSLMDRLSRV